jgi:hypothetical protein
MPRINLPTGTTSIGKNGRASLRYDRKSEAAEVGRPNLNWVCLFASQLNPICDMLLSSHDSTHDTSNLGGNLP